MKTAHIARPQYPAYRASSRITASYPVRDLALAAVAICIIAWCGLQLIAAVQA